MWNGNLNPVLFLLVESIVIDRKIPEVIESRNRRTNWEPLLQNNIAPNKILRRNRMVKITIFTQLHGYYSKQVLHVRLSV